METPNPLYIELMKLALTDFNRLEFIEYQPAVRVEDPAVQKFLEENDYVLCRKKIVDPEVRRNGQDWPANADTMIGIKRLENIEFCVLEILKNNIEGDLIETGVWRGGATIFMKALLKAAGIENRTVWVADSFEGLPPPDEEKYPVDKGDRHHTIPQLAISFETVRHNFEKYGLLDDGVKFLKGWFKDTLPSAPIEKLALLRLDGDMYESTMDALVSLYPKLSVGGYIIIDDWGAVPGCKAAVEDYRKEHGITEEIVVIDWAGVYWKKEKSI